MPALSNVDQVWLFGSYAREEPKESSDIDVLFISENDCSELVETMVREKIACDRQMDISHYTRDGISTLVNQASLFTWHLREEGIPLYEGSAWLRDMLCGMSHYQNHERDLVVLLQLVEEAAQSLRKSRSTAIFDAGVVSTGIRNTAIILTNFLRNTDYSPRSPQTLTHLEPTLKLPIPISEYWKWVECRHASERGNSIDSFSLNVSMLRENIQKIPFWQSKCIEYIANRSSENVH